MTTEKRPRSGPADSLPQPPTSPYEVTAGLNTTNAYLEHAAVMRRIALRKFRVPPADADALVQDVFINFIACSKNVRHDVRAYLIASISNACRNYWRSRKVENRVFVDNGANAVDELLSDHDLFEQLSTKVVVASTLARLHKRCREALRRYYMEGEDTRTVAAALDTSCANVNFIMHKCRKRARAIYEEITRIR